VCRTTAPHAGCGLRAPVRGVSVEATCTLGEPGKIYSSEAGRSGPAQLGHSADQMS
jgi:hypothetical protein